MVLEIRENRFDIEPYGGKLASNDPDGDGTPGISDGDDTVDVGDAPYTDRFEDLVKNSEAFPEVCKGFRDGYTCETCYDWNHSLRYLQELYGANQLWEDARISYRDNHEDYAGSGGVVGHAMYPQGHYDNYTKDGRQEGYDVLLNMENSNTWTWQHEDFNGHHYWNSSYMREAGYGLLTLMLFYDLVDSDSEFASLMEDSPTDPHDRFRLVLRKLESMCYQNINLDWSDVPNVYDDGGEVYNKVKPFMVGIALHALARYHEVYGNQHWNGDYFSTLEDAQVELARWMREDAKVREDGYSPDTLWLPEANGTGPDGEGWGTYRYQDVASDAEGEYPDVGNGELNNMIAPGYAYAGVLTGEKKYIDYADELFIGAIQCGTDDCPAYAYNTAYKQMGQMIHSVDDYFRWRQEFRDLYE